MVHSPQIPWWHTLSHIKLWCAESTFCVTSCSLWLSEPALSCLHLLPTRWECLWWRWFSSAADHWYSKQWVTHQAERIRDLPQYSRQYKPDREPRQAKTPELAEQLTLGTLISAHHSHCTQIFWGLFAHFWATLTGVTICFLWWWKIWPSN